MVVFTGHLGHFIFCGWGSAVLVPLLPESIQRSRTSRALTCMLSNFVSLTAQLHVEG
jgi:hypothetical protein